MKRDGGRSMNRLFRDILRENKNDYIRTVLGCSWIISLIYFSTAVGGCLSYISTGSIPQMTYLIIEVEKEFLPMQPGDVYQTYADVSELEKDFGFKPDTPLEVGLTAFAEWYAKYYSREK